MPTFRVGDRIQYVGGGRSRGSQAFDGHQNLDVGDVGFVHAIPGNRGKLGCTFGTLRVSLDKVDVQLAANLPDQLTRDMEKSEFLPAVHKRRTPLAVTSGSSSSFRRSRPAAAQQPARAAPRYCSRGPAGRARLAVAVARLSALEGQGAEAEAAGAPPQESSQEDSSEPQAERERLHPPSFYCPISRQCMHDPVVLTDGHTYERRYIEQWLQLHNTSPVSGALLPNKTVFPNHALRNAIEEYFEEVLLGHRQSIRQTTAGLFRQRGKFSINARLLTTINALMQCSILVNADLSIEMVLKKLTEEAKNLLGAEAASVFLLDHESQELYSSVNSTGTELRIPSTSGVAGHVVRTGHSVRVQDAYCDSRFNMEIDRMTGFKTRNILCVPIRAWTGIIGVAQLINKTAGGVLSFSQTENSDFTSDDQHFFEVLAAQAGCAIVNSGIFHQRLTAPSSRSEGDFSGKTRSSVTSTRSSAPLQASASDVDACTSGTGIPPSQRRRLPLQKLPSSDPSRRGYLIPFLKEAWEGWETDTLTLAELTDNKPLSVLAMHLFEQHGLISHFSLDRVKLELFVTEIEAGYPDANLYHNRCHAASVLHSMHALLLHGGLAEACSEAAAAAFPDGDRQQVVILVGLLAAVVHDFEHDGVSNDFHVMTKSDKAITYNDKSVNEQHHLAAAFRLLMQPECNFLEGMETHKFQKIRSMMLDLVLATDMAEHGRIVDSFKVLIQSPSGEGESAKLVPACAEDALLVLKVALKCADLGHLALSWGLHVRWVRRLEEEFFRQGDLEKECTSQPKVSFLMDRCKPGVSQSQMGFFDFVVLPLFRTFFRAFPGVGPMSGAVEANYERWRTVEASLDSAK